MKSVIKDITLAPSGHDKIAWVKNFMPVLRHIDEEYSKTKPFAGKRMVMTMHLEAKTAYLALVLKNAGAEVIATGSNPLSTQDDVVAALVEDGITVFAKYDCTPEEYDEYIDMALATKPDMIMDDGGDLVYRIHNQHPELISHIIGGSEETTTGVHRLYQMHARGELRFPAINVNDSVTKSKFDNLYGCRESLVDGIKRATDVMIAGKVAVVVGYGDVGKGCAQALRALAAQVWVVEIDPICALQAAMEGYRVVTMEWAADKADIFVTATGNYHVITHDHMVRMKDQAIVCNIGHFDSEIDVASMKQYKWENIKPQVDHIELPSGNRIILLAEGRLVNLGCATGHPSYVMSSSFANQVLAQIELFTHTDKYPVGVYILPKILDEKVARLQLTKLNAELSVLTQKQADYIGVKVEGPYKSENYRY